MTERTSPASEQPKAPGASPRDEVLASAEGATRSTHLWFLESLDQIHRAMQGTDDVEQLMRNVLDVVRRLFGADRAGFLYPCDPDAASWSLVTDGAWPRRAREPAIRGPITGELADVLRVVRDAGGPVALGLGAEHPLPLEVETLGIGAALVTAVRPAARVVYLFGMSHALPRQWSPDERRLLDEIGRRVGDVLRTLHTLFRALVDHAPDAVEVIDPDSGRFLDVNRRACAAHGYTREEYLALGVSDIDPLVAERSWEDVREDMRRAGDGVFETQHRRKDGSVFPVEVNVTFVRLDRDYMIAVVRDITERKRAEAALTESHSLFRAVVEGTSDAVYVKALDGRHLLINAAGARFLGATEAEVIGKRASELLPPEDADALAAHDRQVTASGASETFEERVTAGGVTRTFVSTKSVCRDARGDAIGVIGISSEVTDLKRLEPQLWQAQKMEAAGRLAGGVAHDFNNLLTVITGYAFMLRQELPADSEAYGDVEQVLSAAERGAGLTRQLLAFSRRQRLQPQVIDLSQPVAAVSGMLRRVIGEDITLQTEIAPNAWPVLADPGQLEQVVMNLALNARDAMPLGGRLTIATAHVTVARETPALPAPLAPGEYVRLTVSDTGTGMSPEVMQHAFEPFFTSKAPGKGTGLGLSTVYGIVTQSRGRIRLQSAPGRGTTFEIFFPREDREVAGVIPAAAPAEGRGSETVLVVEDDPMLRRLAESTLERAGYQVLTAADAAEGLRLAREHEGPIHVVVTDVVMPGLPGPDLVARLERARPGVRALYMSGYTEHALLQDGITEDSVTFLPKPFGPDELARRVRQLLDAGR